MSSGPHQNENENAEWAVNKISCISDVYNPSVRLQPNLIVSKSGDHRLDYELDRGLLINPEE